MRHLTVSTALLAGCLIAGAAWAQGSSGGSSGGSAGSGGSSSSSSSTTGSSMSPSTARPSGSTLRPPAQSPQGSADPGNRASRVGGTTGNTGTGSRDTTSPIPPPGTEGSTGGAATGARGSQTGPATTGTVAGDRLQPGERSSVNPSSREEKLLEEADKRVKRGICQGC